jgi:hypothetical protein
VSRLTIAGLATGLLLSVGLTACGDQGAASSAGDVVIGHASDEVSGDSAFVLVPAGRIDLTVGEPLEELTDEQVGDGRRAPDGGSFVPVSWEHDPFGEGAVPVGVVGDRPQEAEVTLVAGETRADLGSPYRVVADKGTTDTGVSTMYVAVDRPADDLGDVTFEVAYDGLTQTVDPATGERDAGAAAPLYDEPTVGVEAPCTSEGFATSEVRPDISCVVNAPQRTPYLSGQGWAADGRTWLLVSVYLTLDDVQVGGTSYDVEDVMPRLTLGGTDPLPPDGRFGTPEMLDGGLSGTWAFDAVGGGVSDLTIALDCLLDKADDGGPGPSTREVTLEQTIPLG